MMLIVDVNTGKHLSIGTEWTNICGRLRVTRVRRGFLLWGASVEVSIDGRPPVRCPLTVRYTHPSFPLRRVGFLDYLRSRELYESYRERAFVAVTHDTMLH